MLIKATNDAQGIAHAKVSIEIKLTRYGHMSFIITSTPRKMGVSNQDRFARSGALGRRSEEHTSELQSRENLVCRLLLEKKNKQNKRMSTCTLRRDPCS